MKLIFLVFCYIVGNTVAIDLPFYFPRCVLSDPNFKYCGIAAANIVIPRLVQGDKDLGVPATNLLYWPKGEIGGSDFKISLTDAYTYDFQKFRLTDGMLDLKNNKTGFTATTDFTNSFGDYSISNGKVRNRSVFGTGKGALTLVEPILRFETGLNFYEKDGETYAKLVNATVKLTVNRAYYRITGLRSSEQGQDLEHFIYENWEALYAETKPSLENYFNAVIQSIIDPILEKVPFTSIFVQ